MTLHSIHSDDERREEKCWHGMRDRRKGKGARLAVQTRVMPGCEFDDPIGLLKNDHLKIKRALHVLWVIADRAAGRALTNEEMYAVRSAMNCVRVDGARHTADEEESLFPRLRAKAITGDSEELSVIEDNRRIADRQRAIVQSLYSAWMSAGALRSESQLRLQSCTETLKRLFEQHIQSEERIVFPRAQQLLDAESIAAIGQEVRARRR